MTEQEKRVLDLAKRYGAKMREAKQDDPDLTPTTQEEYEAKTAKAEGHYSDAQDILENLEDAIEVLIEQEQFVPLEAHHRALLYMLAEKLDEQIVRLQRLRNAYYGMSASANTQEDFDRWDSEIISEENALSEVEKKVDEARDALNRL